MVIGFWVTVGSNFFSHTGEGETAPFWGSIRENLGENTPAGLKNNRSKSFGLGGVSITNVKLHAVMQLQTNYHFMDFGLTFANFINYMKRPGFLVFNPGKSETRAGKMGRHLVKQLCLKTRILELFSDCRTASSCVLLHKSVGSSATHCLTQREGIYGICMRHKLLIVAIRHFIVFFRFALRMLDETALPSDVCDGLRNRL
ncbi:hypothetical protein AVEN_213895-1 [Araneus ventricosus]|uniref:Uncharacterized protein n=1 Tax=Araneus ventricosus TaxID=182803 RepID=A0A4Y2KE90_ARAVE|nr:hypothetical protein AVEN_213895-1 [Araneus ventricosus]